jgi:hypothetical protein
MRNAATDTTNTKDVVDFAEVLRETINDKINQCSGDMHESHNPVHNNSLLIEMQALMGSGTDTGFSD